MHTGNKKFLCEIQPYTCKNVKLFWNQLLTQNITNNFPSMRPNEVGLPPVTTLKKVNQI